MAQGHLARDNLRINFSTEFVVAGGRYLSYCNHQLNKFEEDKRFGLYEIMKRERHTHLKNFLARYPGKLFAI